MRLPPVLVGLLMGGGFCGCTGLLSGLVTGAGDLVDVAGGAYISDYEAGHIVGSLAAAPCCVGSFGAFVGAAIGALVGRSRQ